MNYMGCVAMISISWIIAMVISMVKSEMLHGKVPRRNKGHTYSGGSLKGKTEWMMYDDKGKNYLLNSDCKPITNIEILGIIFMWVFLPVASAYYAVFRKKINVWVLVIGSILLLCSPFIYSILSRVDVVINFN